jgi:hypothetical protein
MARTDDMSVRWIGTGWEQSRQRGRDTDAKDPAMTTNAYFTSADGAVFEPTPAAGGHWGASLISGPAVAGIAAYALERDFGRQGFTPARFAIDLIKPAKQAPTVVETRVVREGRRVRYTECDVVQGDSVVARATMVQYLQSEAPPGQEWTPGDAFHRPAAAVGTTLLVGSDDAGWGVLGAEHQNTSRKRAYYRGLDVIAGEPVSPFVRAAIVAEATTNMVLNMGTEGIGYINGDLTVTLARLPRSEFIGVQGDSRFAAAGVATGTATLFDDHGPIGTAIVTALANPAAQIDFGAASRTAGAGAELFSQTAEKAA